jgi:glycosyltransferase involved in cell wall biosynthesis
MKIAYFSPFSNKAAVTFRIRELDKFIGFDRTIFYYEDGYGVSKKYGNHVHLIPGYRKNKYFVSYALKIVKLAQNCSIVIFLKPYPAHVLAALILKIFGKKIVFDFDEIERYTQRDIRSGLFGLFSAFLWSIMENFAARIGSSFIVSNKRIPEKLGLKNIFFLPNFIDFNQFETTFFNPECDRNIIYAGSFHNAKEIIDCLTWVDATRYKIILIGEGSQLNIVKDFLNANKFSYVFHGYLSNVSLIKKLNSLRGVFVAPYKKSKRVKFSSSGKLPIYMGTGCPIIVSKVEGPLDFEAGEDFFFKYDNPYEIKPILGQIFDGGAFDEPRRRAQLSTAAKYFNIEKLGHELMDFLKQI